MQYQSCINRSDLKNFHRIIVKMGSAIVSTPGGEPALGRIASLIEQICTLKRSGKEVLLVTSGAIGIGRKKMHRQVLLSASLRQHVHGTNQLSLLEKKAGACAAAGQIGLMALYETLFSLYDVACAQVLVTAVDFQTEERCTNMMATVNNLLASDIIPIVNENDAVCAPADGTLFTDNDSLAALFGGIMQADLVVLLTDVDGLFDKPPTEPGSKLISIFQKGTTNISIGEKSSLGRGGMGSKIEAAQGALGRGVKAVVIANGLQYGIISSIMKGSNCGTLFVQNPPPQDHSSDINTEAMAKAARNASRILQEQPSGIRQAILHKIADQLVCQKQLIFQENNKDIETAESNNIDRGLLSRLKLTEEKLHTLADGIHAIANGEEPIGKLLSSTEISAGLVLHQETAPIGVLLVIFESRPDSLPQIAALSIRSGNGLLLKGGKEAKWSNRILHKLIVDAIYEGSEGKVARDVVALVKSREEVSNLLKLDHVIDLCIPRGSGELVKYIKSNTRIPVLGHAEGVCHVYIDEFADEDKAIRIAVDAKTDYPSACNACETLLVHRNLVGKELAGKVFSSLIDKGVTLFLGPVAKQMNLISNAPLAKKLSHEYGNLGITIEIVNSLEEAIHHINTYSSGHTECIVTEHKEQAEIFLAHVDSSCVFHNASNRFADGFRFGLGAEVGISTGRIHARGPVGVEGLLTTKWKLRSTLGHTVSQFAENHPHRLSYTHRKMNLLPSQEKHSRL